LSCWRNFGFLEAMIIRNRSARWLVELLRPTTAMTPSLEGQPSPSPIRCNFGEGGFSCRCDERKDRKSGNAQETMATSSPPSRSPCHAAARLRILSTCVDTIPVAAAAEVPTPDHALEGFTHQPPTPPFRPSQNSTLILIY
jgi:hypothetical protein